jgi:hypothetical protein
VPGWLHYRGGGILNKGIYVWNVAYKDGDVVKEYSSPEGLAAELKAGGFGHALLKVCDGTARFGVINGVDYLPEYVKAIKAAGIAVWGWGYVYGTYPAGEAAVAIERCKELGLSMFVVDAEAEYKNKPYQARTYMTAVRKGLPDAVLALSSFRFPTYHREFPFREFAEHCNLMMPQVYWEGAKNAGDQLRRCVSEYTDLGFGLPIAVTGAAYKSTSVSWQPTAGEVQEFYQVADEMGLEMVNFWEWQCAKKINLWQTLMALEGEVTEPDTNPEDNNPDYISEDEIRTIVRDEVEKILSEATATILTDSIKMLVREEMKVLVDALTLTLSQWEKGL